MELADYNITFVHIKGKNNVLAHTISRLKTLSIYKEPLENPKIQLVSNTQGHVTEISATHMHTISTSMLCTKQKWDKMCRNLALQIYHCNKVSYYVCKWYSAKTTISSWVKALCHHSTTFNRTKILHEFHDSKDHQGAIHTF